MAFLDFIKNRSQSPQPSVAQIQQSQAEPTRSVESLPDSVKAQAVEAARPAAALMDKATTPSSTPPQATPNQMGRGRSLGMER